jgi:hypothetical protein
VRERARKSEPENVEQEEEKEKEERGGERERKRGRQYPEYRIQPSERKRAAGEPVREKGATGRSGGIRGDIGAKSDGIRAAGGKRKRKERSGGC